MKNLHRLAPSGFVGTALFVGLAVGNGADVVTKNKI
jgi:hypothetical protein